MAARQICLLASVTLAVAYNEGKALRSNPILASQPTLASDIKMPVVQFSDGQQMVNELVNNGIMAAAEPTTKKVRAMEDSLMELIKKSKGAKGTPMGESVESMKKLITDDMIPKIFKAHADDQKYLDGLIKDLGEGCDSVRKEGESVAEHQKSQYVQASASHKNCRMSEASYATMAKSCDMEVKAARQIQALKCKQLSDMQKTYGATSNNVAIVTKRPGETTDNYIMRLTTSYCGTGGEDSLFAQYSNAKGYCQEATNSLKESEMGCVATKSSYKMQLMNCNNIQLQMDGAACQRAVLVKDSCEHYASCFTDKAAMFAHANKTVAEQEKERKAEYKASKRMECLINSFGDSQVTDVEVKACKAKTHDTSRLNIKYNKLPKMKTCAVPDLYPSTPAYKKKEYAPLPAMAKADPEANECYGILEISTAPKSGSPASCKCSRITMNGPFSAGPIVKCENCLDVSRSTNKNSCPDGTKIFSPRSQSDWATFMSSTVPLGDPNFIIDVTQKANGCGGCAKYPMNSAEKGQNMWGTDDGSPWWLRSAKYSQPVANYQANCYLGLLDEGYADQEYWWVAGEERHLNFKANSCNYHSKSYYCQKKIISTKPRHGSPTTCKCSVIETVGKYSPGNLLKCIGCLDARRANDKNSCPEGTKIFSPRSRGDWKVFLDSATPLRSPHWIIDITLPTNGCGGCTRYSMSSATPQQSTWKTSDSSPWWLRSTRYSEPNGDYNAGCYLDLWRTPQNENSITWNDGRCNYHSNAYYCQSAKAAR